MGTLLTSIILLLLAAALLRGLRHPFYALHIALVAAALWAAQRWLGIQAPAFSHRALVQAGVAHLCVINLITWLAYAQDKRASIRGAWRIPERTLHAFALLGGTPAAWLAQKILRHKNRKHGFQWRFWLIFLLQLGALTASLLHPLR